MKFVIPRKQFEMGARTIKIKHKVEVGQYGEANGMALFERGELVIDPSMPEDVQLEILIHEWVEWANFLYELGLDHNVIQSLGAALGQAIKSAK